MKFHVTKAIDSLSAYYLGFGLAVFSTILIGLAFILKKRALLRASLHSTRAGDGGLLYLRDWLWWLGLGLFALGEGSNFIAYALAPASLVTPLGGLSVLFSALLSARFLNERLSAVAKLGCFVCLSGSTLVVLHAPKEQHVDSLVEIQAKFFDRAFLIYGTVVLLVTSFLILYLGPRSGRTNPLIYVLIAASLGSISVMACKGIGIAVQESIIFGPEVFLQSWFFWFLLGLLIFGLVIQLYYLNRALDLFNTGLITALLYVFFTAFVLIASAILFREWTSLKLLDYVELTVGLLLITLGVFMMSVLKELDINWKGLCNLYNAVQDSIHKNHKRAKVTLSLTADRLRRQHSGKWHKSPAVHKETVSLLAHSGDTSNGTSPDSDLEHDNPLDEKSPSKRYKKFMSKRSVEVV